MGVFAHPWKRDSGCWELNYWLAGRGRDGRLDAVRSLVHLVGNRVAQRIGGHDDAGSAGGYRKLNQKGDE